MDLEILLHLEFHCKRAQGAFPPGRWCMSMGYLSCFTMPPVSPKEMSLDPQPPNQHSWPCPIHKQDVASVQCYRRAVFSSDRPSTLWQFTWLKSSRQLLIRMIVMIGPTSTQVLMDTRLSRHRYVALAAEYLNVDVVYRLWQNRIYHRKSIDGIMAASSRRTVFDDRPAPLSFLRPVDAAVSKQL